MFSVLRKFYIAGFAIYIAGFGMYISNFAICISNFAIENIKGEKNKFKI